MLLIGLGHFGKHVAYKLNELGHQVMAVDIREERVDEVLPFVTNAQIGDGTNQEFLESLGINNFDVCIVAIGNDFQSSLETTSLLKELGARMVVAQTCRDVHAKFLLRNGADKIVYPDKQLAYWTAIRFGSNHVLDYIDLGHDYAIYEVEIPADWVGKTIVELDIRKKYNLNILAVKTNGKMDLNMDPHMPLSNVDTMLVLGSQKAVQKCFRT